MKTIVQVGQVWLVSFRGSGNGDMILGRVTRLGFLDSRGEPAVELTDLLTPGKTHTKKERNLLDRNWLGTDAYALEVQQVARDDGKAEARLWAVLLRRSKSGLALLASRALRMRGISHFSLRRGWINGPAEGVRSAGQNLHRPSFREFHANRDSRFALDCTLLDVSNWPLWHMTSKPVGNCAR